MLARAMGYQRCICARLYRARPSQPQPNALSRNILFPPLTIFFIFVFGPFSTSPLPTAMHSFISISSLSLPSSPVCVCATPTVFRHSRAWQTPLMYLLHYYYCWHHGENNTAKWLLGA